MDFDIASRFLLVFLSLFVIVEPFGAVPAFVGLTRDFSAQEIRQTARRASLFAAGVLIFFSLFGIWVFRFLQIDMNAFRAAGGLLLLMTALDMLRASKNRESCRCSVDELSTSAEREDISLVPLAIPMLAGPGAITSVMVFSTDHTSSHVAHFAIILAAVGLTFIISYFVLSASVAVKQRLGKSGISILERIMGLLLAAVSLQFLIQGAAQLVKSYW